MTLAGSLPAYAAPNDPKDFDQAAFEQAQKQGEPILIDIYASWCDVCKSQVVILDTLRKTPKYASLVTFRINYDTQKDLMRTFKATVQSTLILYRGKPKSAVPSAKPSLSGSTTFCPRRSSSRRRPESLDRLI